MVIDRTKSLLFRLMPYALVFLSLGIFIVIMVFIVDSYILPDLVHDRKTVVVPDITGKTLDDAEKILDSKELKLVVVSKQYSAKVKDGIIISQVPKPDKTVKKGRRINITISQGEENVKMPQLIGKHQRAAKIELMNTGLKIGEMAYSFSEEYGADTVVGQSISYGRKISFGKEVNLVISKGSEMQVITPNLISSDYNEIESILSESELILGKVTWKESDGTFISNTIVAQSPKAGELIKKNMPVNITVIK